MASCVRSLVVAVCIASFFLLRRTPSLLAFTTHNGTLREPALCVVSRVHFGGLRTAPSSISSLWPEDGYSALHIFFLRTDSRDQNEKPFLRVVSHLNQLGPPLTSLLAIDGRRAKQLFPQMKNDFGYIATDIAIEQLSGLSLADFCRNNLPITVEEGAVRNSEHPRCRTHNRTQPLCDFFLFTNADNLYAQPFLSQLRVLMRKDEVLLGWDFISHHSWPPRSPGVCPEQGGDFVHMTSAYSVARVDLGVVAVKADVFRESTQMRFIIDKLREKLPITDRDIWNADGMFFEKVLALRRPTMVSHRTWTLHQ